ncbi:BTAD domain-containing putative transcriptional regulator [Nonomuraea sp. NPDC048892]|uniref:BTAD domain-containing putative transcriptional regulator n=1 Tax=Nonomuraea sp. NPDC048892 TaxID=3154624 RepID=UPI0033F1EF81
MRFRMLGPLRVHTGGGWVGVAAEQQRVVLAVLLVEAGRVVSTDQLVDAVWGERPPRTAANTIAAYVSRLRRLVGRDVLAGRRRGYELLADGDIDAVLFEGGVAAGRRELKAGRLETAAAALGRALALWRTPEPVLADVPSTRWVETRTAELEQLRLGAVEDHADARLRLGLHADLVEELDRQVREQPLRERRWALLMTALARSGRRAEALDAYQRARRLLGAELGLEPGPRLRELQQAILVNDAPAPIAGDGRAGAVAAEAVGVGEEARETAGAAGAGAWTRATFGAVADDGRDGEAREETVGQETTAAAAAAVAVVVRSWPFLGREDELETIGSCLGRDEARGVVIAGEAGIGKTRLAQEILALARSRGHRTEWVAATGALASIPFGAVAGLLSPSGGTNGREAGHGLPMLEAAAARLRERGGARRVVIGVDDAHLLDTGSAAVLDHLVAQRLAFVVATLRAGEPVPETIMRLWKDGQVPWLDLASLPQPAVDRLLDHVLDGAVDGVTRRRLRELALGNPLALRELLTTAITGRTLRRRHGVWHLAGDYRPQGAIQQMLADRLRPLGPRTPELLELLACGEPLPYALLARLVDQASVDEAEAHGLAVSERAGDRVHVRLAHPLYAEVLRARMSPAHARRLWWRLAGALLDTPLRRRDDLLRAALWQVEGGAVVRPEVVRIGARQAVNRADLALAERLARAARQAAPSVEADALLAEVLEYRGRSAEAVAVLPERPPRDDDELLAWALVRAETRYWGEGDAVAAERTLDLLRGRPGEGLAEGIRSWILLLDGRCAATVELAERLTAPGSAAGDQPAIWACAAATAAAGFLGRAADADRFHRHGLALAEANQAELPWGLVQLGIARSLAYLALGELDAAWRVADEGYRQVLEGQSPMMSAGHVGFRGLVECAQGRTAEAGRSLREAMTALDGRDTLRLTHLFTAGLATACALEGAAGEARAWLERADRSGNGSNRLFAPWAALADAWTSSAEGHHAEAVSTARYAADLAHALGLRSVEATARHDVLRLTGPAALDGYGVADGRGGQSEPGRQNRPGGLGETGEPGGADRHSGPLDAPLDAPLDVRLDTPLARALATAARGLANADGDALSEATDALARTGHHLLATETATCAARAYEAAGLTEQSEAARRRAAGLRTRCQAAITPLLTDAPERAQPATAVPDNGPLGAQPATTLPGDGPEGAQPATAVPDDGPEGARRDAAPLDEDPGRAGDSAGRFGEGTEPARGDAGVLAAHLRTMR